MIVEAKLITGALRGFIPCHPEKVWVADRANRVRLFPLEITIEKCRRILSMVSDAGWLKVGGSISALLIIWLYTHTVRPVLVKEEHLSDSMSLDEKVVLMLLALSGPILHLAATSGISSKQAQRNELVATRLLKFMRHAFVYEKCLGFIESFSHDKKYFMLRFEDQARLASDHLETLVSKGFQPVRFISGNSAYKKVEEIWFRIDTLNPAPRDEKWQFKRIHLLAADFILFKKSDESQSQIVA